MAIRKRITCPFCEGGGCCFCEHEGVTYVGPNEMLKSEDSVGVRYLKHVDKQQGGGLEVWPEMWEHFLDEKNVPADFDAPLPLPQWVNDLLNKPTNKDEQ